MRDIMLTLAFIAVIFLLGFGLGATAKDSVIEAERKKAIEANVGHYVVDDKGNVSFVYALPDTKNEEGKK